MKGTSIANGSGPSVRGTFRSVLLVLIYVILVVSEGIALFAARTVRFSIEGTMPYAIDAFGDRAMVEHEFLMAGDGLNAVSVRLAAARPMSFRVLTTLSSVEPSAPDRRAALYRWVSDVTLKHAITWKRFDFPPLTASNDRYYSFRIQLVDGTLSDDPGTPRPIDPLPVAIMASHDNPPRGGALWISGIRQTGSLYLRAHTPGETAYERFRLSMEPRLPPLLRHFGAQVLIVLVYQWALLAFADALLFGEMRDAACHR